MPKPKTLKTAKPPRDPYPSCPRCGCVTITRYANERQQIAVCRGYNNDDGEPCAWESEPYTPSRRSVRTTLVQSLDISHGGWVYEAFDQYGITFALSETFSRRSACEAAALKELEAANKIAGYGECCAVIWPPSVRVRGTLLRRKRAVKRVKKPGSAKPREKAGHK